MCVAHQFFTVDFVAIERTGIRIELTPAHPDGAGLNNSGSRQVTRRTRRIAEMEHAAVKTAHSL